MALVPFGHSSRAWVNGMKDVPEQQPWVGWPAVLLGVRFGPRLARQMACGFLSSGSARDTQAVGDAPPAAFSSVRGGEPYSHCPVLVPWTASNGFVFLGGNAKQEGGNGKGGTEGLASYLPLGGLRRCQVNSRCAGG